EELVYVMIGVTRQGELFEVVGTLGPARRLADLLDGGQEQADQDGDDGDHDQQFDQGKGGLPPLSLQSHQSTPFRLTAASRRCGEKPPQPVWNPRLGWNNRRAWAVAPRALPMQWALSVKGKRLQITYPRADALPGSPLATSTLGAGFPDGIGIGRLREA